MQPNNPTSLEAELNDDKLRRARSRLNDFYDEVVQQGKLPRPTIRSGANGGEMHQQTAPTHILLMHKVAQKHLLHLPKGRKGPTG